MDPLFALLPDDLAALSADELNDALAAAVTVRDRIVTATKADATDEDKSFLDGREADQVIAELTAGVDQIKGLRAEIASRPVEASLADRVAELAVEEPAPVVEPVAAEVVEAPVVVEEPATDLAATIAAAVQQGVTSAVAALAPKTDESDPPLPAPRSGHRPVPIVASGTGEVSIVASSGIDGVDPGSELDEIGLAKAMISRAYRLGAPAKSKHGSQERYLIASARYSYGDERMLKAGDDERNTEKIRNLTDPRRNAVLASGGLCAPVTPLYTMPNWAVTSRPVRDAMPSFIADRGGVNVPTPTTIGNVAPEQLEGTGTAISVITAANDKAGGTFATKTFQSLDCPAYNATYVTIISHIRQFGNLGSRAWPEKVAHENALTMAAHARTADGYLLQQIGSLCTSLDGEKAYGAVSTMLYAILRAAAGIRSTLRADENLTLRCLAPFWVGPMLVADLVNQQFDRFSRNTAGALALIRDLANVEVSLYLDEEYGEETNLQIFSPANGSDLAKFPAEIVWYLFPEGGFIHVDGGALELGIVRDSTLNSTNDYEIFGETFENVAQLAPSSVCLKVSSPIFPDGTVAIPATAIT